MSEQEVGLRAVAEMVENVLTAMGYRAPDARMASETGPAWGFRAGSAQVFIFLTSSETGENFIQVVAPLLRPDPDSRKLFRHLLELNASQLTGAAFGIRDDDVVLTTDRSTVGLDQVEVEDMVKRVAEYADFYDDRLASAFGGTRYSDL